MPEAAFEIAGRRVVLHNAGVLMNRGLRSHVGNFGMDLFQQGTAMKLDFSAMRLEVEDGR